MEFAVGNDQRLDRITILGAGVMGSGIATLAIGRGIAVDLVDVDDTILAAAKKGIRKQLRHAHLLGALPADGTVGELAPTTSTAVVADADVVIEAITEDAALKAKVLAEVCGLVAPGTPLISNTSGIPIDELADTLARPQDLLGTHFMNPTYLIEQVETVRGPRTSEAVLATARRLLAALHRETVVVRDAPGFVTSRLLHPMINDAARIVMADTAGVEDVDRLMTGCLGHPTGPLRTADLIGIDNLVDALDALYERTGDERVRPCELLREKVRAGHLGRKSGRGFYDYEEGVS